MTHLEDIERLSAELKGALDDAVDASGWWRDVPRSYVCPDDGWPDRFEMQCSFCDSRFWPVSWRDEHYRMDPFYYQAGYWFGDPGEGRYFPVCSDGCHDALQRQLEKRMVHTKAQMQKIAQARRLILECKATVRRIRAETKRRR